MLVHPLKGLWSIVSAVIFFIPMPDVIQVSVRSHVASNQTELILLQLVGGVGKEGTAQMKTASRYFSRNFPSLVIQHLGICCLCIFVLH